MTLKLGIIGAGGIGQVHLQAAADNSETVSVTWIADVNAESSEKAAKKFNIPNHAGDPQELIDSSDVDAVIVAVPNKFHAPLAKAVLAAGKDVLIEKPMAMNTAQCQEVIDLAQDRILQIGLVHRYSSVATTAKQFIEAGRLGDIYHAKTNIYRRRGIPGLGGWFTTKDVSGGGPLIDLGVHIMDLAMFLMGDLKPVRVSGKVYANFTKDMKNYLYENMWAGPPRLDGTCDVEDSAHALIRFEHGVTMEVNATWAGNFPEGSLPNIIGVFGNKGGATFQIGGDRVQIATEEDGHNVDIEPLLRKTNPFTEQMRVFAHNVKTRTQPHANGEAGKRVQSLIDAIYQSSELDREVEL